MLSNPFDTFDRWLLTTVDRHRSAALDWVAQLLLNLGHAVLGVAVLGAIVLVAVAVLRIWRPALACLLAFMIAGRVADLLKDVIERPRPSAALAITPAYGYSMPSSVAAATSAAAVGLLLAVNWKSAWVKQICVLCAGAALVVVGLAMIYLGAHWASDVLVGWLLGSLIGLAVGLLFRRWGNRSRTVLRPGAQSR